MIDKPRIVFFGTPDFAVRSLELILEFGYPVVAVVTVPDKPAGRGLKLKSSSVKQFALKNHLPVLQPVSLKDPGFTDQLASFSPDLQIIVAFRMLPREVWSLPPMGTFNLHASLLPQYRGAAPINWALINGERETGVTTFLLDEAIDTGKILMSKTLQVGETENAGMLHDRLKNVGAELVIETIAAMTSCKIEPLSQQMLIDPSTPLKMAPKIHKDDCLIDWDQNAITIFNKIRGLSPYPGTYTVLQKKNGESLQIKVLNAEPRICKDHGSPGEIQSDGKTRFSIAAQDGFVDLKEVQVKGHRVVQIADFLNGFGKYFV